MTRDKSIDVGWVGAGLTWLVPGTSAYRLNVDCEFDNNNHINWRFQDSASHVLIAFLSSVSCLDMRRISNYRISNYPVEDNK